MLFMEPYQALNHEELIQSALVEIYLLIIPGLCYLVDGIKTKSISFPGALFTQCSHSQAWRWKVGD